MQGDTYLQEIFETEGEKYGINVLNEFKFSENVIFFLYNIVYSFETSGLIFFYKNYLFMCQILYRMMYRIKKKGTRLIKKLKKVVIN